MTENDQKSVELVRALRNLHAMLSTPLPASIHQMYIAEVLEENGFQLDGTEVRG